ncbi:MAG TPA: AcvB/VirJ family lysyl-phosphatidylglycerol hydrolase, partial [Steroidobacteraceae bacterium]
WFSSETILRIKCDQPMKIRLILAAAALLSGFAAASPTHLSHGRFKDFPVYAASGPTTSFAFLVSGDEGWDLNAEMLAELLAQQGAMVVGIDLAKFKAVLEADGGQCVFPDGDLENLSHFVQAYFHNSTYLPPILVGTASGGAFAYAVLAQAPKDTFAGALSLGYCPTLTLRKPLCKGSGLELRNPWVVLTAPKTASCPVEGTRQFVSQVHGAAIAVLPDVVPQSVSAAFAKLAAAGATRALPPTPAALGDLPVIEVAAKPGSQPSDTFAILISGDGGWAGLDQDIAGALSAKGIPVVGLDSLRYFWTARTPEGVAADTDRMIRYYSSHFGKKRVLLIGYSQGADVLPFAVNRLPQAAKAQVALMAILGMSEHALFEFHVSSWISDDNSGPPTLPEVNRITGVPVLCIYGEDEPDSLCPKLDPAKFKIVKLKGGHHFDGDYTALANQILMAATPSTRAIR